MPDQITTEEFADHMDAFEQRLGARASRSVRRIEAIDSRLDALDGRLDTIDTRLDVIDGRLRELVEAIEQRGAASRAAVETTIDKAHGVEVNPPKASCPARGLGAKTARVTLGAPRASDGPAQRKRQRRSRT